MRLFQLGIPIGSIDVLLLTHFHSDHVVGIPDLWLTGWLGGRFGCRTTPMRVIGPAGTKRLLFHMAKAFSADIAIRTADEQLPECGSQIDAHEFSTDGVIFSDKALRVSCFEVDHGRLIKPAFGYRFDYAGQSTVISGDTRYSENLIAHSQNADLLVHEVALAHPEAMKMERVRRVIGHHSTPEDAARVFNRTRPRLAVYNHIVLISDDENDPPSIDDLISETRRHYSGPLVIGTDLLSFDVGSSGVATSSGTDLYMAR